MKLYQLLLSVFAFSLTHGLTVTAQTPRSEISFDYKWKFSKGEIPGAEAASFDDKSWRSIDLPHDWSIENLPNQSPGDIIGPFTKKALVRQRLALHWVALPGTERLSP